MVLADTNILSTFAKIGELPLLMRLFAEEGIGVVPAVYEELHQRVSKGYVALQAAIELVQRRYIELVMPNAGETLEKSVLPPSFDAGERETIAVARARGARQRGFGLGQPAGHVHGAVEVDGGGQGGAGLLPLTGLAIQPAQPVVAVGLQRAHAQLLG